MRDASDEITLRIVDTVTRYLEDRRMREARIYTLIGRLHELAAEGKPMDAHEVEFMASMLPVEKLT